MRFEFSGTVNRSHGPGMGMTGAPPTGNSFQEALDYLEVTRFQDSNKSSLQSNCGYLEHCN